MRARPGEEVACERLGWAFVAKARRTRDDGIYMLAAATGVMRADFGAIPEERLLRGHVAHQLESKARCAIPSWKSFRDKRCCERTTTGRARSMRPNGRAAMGQAAIRIRR